MAKQKYTDPNGRHARIYATLLNSPAWRVLGYASKALFVDLREKLGPANNGNIEATLGMLKHKGWKSPGTLSKALYELRSVGFLAQTRGGGVEFGSRVCSLYRFTDLPVFDFPKYGISASPATHDYLQCKTVQEAEVALREGVQKLQESARIRKGKMAARKTTLQEQYRTDSKIVALEGVNRSKNCSKEDVSASKTVSQEVRKKCW